MKEKRGLEGWRNRNRLERLGSEGAKFRGIGKKAITQSKMELCIHESYIPVLPANIYESQWQSMQLITLSVFL